MSHKIPSYHGQGYAMVYESSSCSAQRSAEEYLDDFLIERRNEIDAKPSLRITDRLTQRGAWYRVRPIMVGHVITSSVTTLVTLPDLHQSKNEL
jgi:hypothetical protein